MEDRFIRCIVSSQVSGAARTVAAAATMLPAAAKRTLAPNYFDAIGQNLEIFASGKITSVITTPGTARYDIRLGGTVIFDGLAVLLDTVAGHTDVGWKLYILLTLQAIGAAATFMGYGEWTCEDLLGVPATAPKGVLSAVLPWNTAPVQGGTFDSTASQQLDGFFTQTVATGSMTCTQFIAKTW